ncbi:protein of unknown function [Methylotuvimicrobium alcaliphilum 20Z]|uniref:Uncharacterized protein n=1 Tax=Methylotuvimicrobium alcaliphilum (strain DSM 19304 / NCIMB 14124 / VKM B-2133 / 20Z) TaxID=1091494 RepID=G4SXZ3_META2|nr:protein of unknown function [Methylotuvimicrobium alcaliphilum 20Z]
MRLRLAPALTLGFGKLKHLANQEIQFRIVAVKVPLAGRGLQPRPKRFDFGRSQPNCLGQTETLGTG